MEKNRIRFKPYIIAGAISLVIGVVIFCLFFFINKMSLAAAENGTSYAGIILIALALLIMITRMGFFDIFAYGFRQLGASMFNKEATKYNNFPAYKQDKNTIRVKKSKYYLSILIIGLLFLIAAIIIMLVLRSM